MRVVALGREPALLVPPNVRHQRIAAKAFIDAVARFNGLKVAWSSDGAAAVLHPGAPDELVQRIRRGLETAEAADRLEAAWLAGTVPDVRLLPALVRAADDSDVDVARQACLSLRRLGWPAVLALQDDHAAWGVAARDPFALMEAMEVLGKTNYRDTLGVASTAVETPVTHARLKAASMLGDIGGEKAQANVEEVVAKAVRLKGIGVLGILRDERALALLEAALRDADADVRRAVARAAAGVGGERALALLRKAVADEAPAVRIAAAEALGRLGGDGALALLERALGDEDRYVRYAAVQALGAGGGNRAASLLKDRALADEQKSVRLKAIVCLGQAAGADALPLLDTYLTDEDLYVRYAAVRALETVPPEKAVPLLDRALSDDEPRVRSGVADVLGRVGREKAVELLARACSDASQDVRDAALTALGEVASEGALQPLQKALADTDAAVRSKAAEALGRVGGPEALNLLAAALGDRDLSVRYSAVRSLGSLTGHAIEDSLGKALTDAEEAVRRQAVIAAGRANGSGTAALLGKALGDEKEPVRLEALKALGDRGGQDALSALEPLLSGEDKTMRVEAIAALGRVGGPKAIDRLGALLAERDQEARLAAITALGHCELTQAIPLLEPALKDRGTVRGAVVALARIGGEQVLPLLGRPEVVDGYPGSAACDAAIAVRCMGGPKTVPLLEKFLFAANSPDARKVAVRGLADAGNEEATDILLKAAGDPGTPTVDLATALSRIGGERVWPVLAKLSSHSDWHVRQAVARGLSGPNLDRPKVEPVLLALLDDKEVLVQIDAVHSLAALGGPAVRDALLARLDPKIHGYVRAAVRQALQRTYPDDELVRKALE